MKTVVTDAGPVIHLAEADALSVLTVLGAVIAPTVVCDEVNCILNDSSWKTTVQIVALGSEQLQQAQVLCSVAGLHLGEAQAIVLAQSSGGTVLLTDDAAARLYASRLGMEVRGSLGLVLASVAKEKLTYDQGLHALHRLRQSSLWLSGKVFEEAVDALREIAGRV
jgi:predicted nucleic acid-binding protein